MSTDLRSANLYGGASENKGAFLFFLENPSKKNYTDGIFKKRLLRKNGPFSGSLAEKIFSVAAREVARRWSARTAARRGVGVRGLLRGVPDGFGVRVDGRSWARVDGRSWASVDGGDGGCACLI